MSRCFSTDDLALLDPVFALINSRADRVSLDDVPLIVADLINPGNEKASTLARLLIHEIEKRAVNEKDAGETSGVYGPIAEAIGQEELKFMGTEEDPEVGPGGRKGGGAHL